MQQTTQQLFLSLGLKPIQLPIGIHGWKISHTKAKNLKNLLGESPKTEKFKFYGLKYSWLSEGPSVLLIPDYWGMAFESEKDAQLFMPRLGQLGATKEVSRWFIKLTGDEARKLLSTTKHTVYPDRIKEGVVYELLTGCKGYLDFWSYSRVHWFPTLDDYKKYETSFLEVDALL
ncbi:MAG: hypothetical protein AAF587_38305 [Bacteroidota bacterium]